MAEIFLEEKCYPIKSSNTIKSQEMNKTKNIIFDFDGTLADTFPLVISILNRIYKLYNLPKVQESEIEEYKKLGVRGLMRKFNMPKLKLIIFAVHIKLLLKKDLDNVNLFKGVEILLKNLINNGYKIIILSSNSRKNISKVLENNEVNLPISVYSEISIIGKEKGLNKIVNKETINKNETLYIGDEVRDYEACKLAGIKFLGVSWGYNSKDALVKSGCENLVDNVKEIENFVKEF